MESVDDVEASSVGFEADRVETQVQVGHTVQEGQTSPHSSMQASCSSPHRLDEHLHTSG